LPTEQKVYELGKGLLIPRRNLSRPKSANRKNVVVGTSSVHWSVIGAAKNYIDLYNFIERRGYPFKHIENRRRKQETCIQQSIVDFRADWNKRTNVVALWTETKTLIETG
jgi:hypothetical protein